MPNYIIPTEENIQSAMAMLFGEDTEISAGEAVAPGTGKVCQIVDYIDPDGATVAACTCDINFGAYSGAALTMMPAATAQDMAKEGDISKPMKDNVYEVMNIISRYLMSENTPHLKLSKSYDEADMPDALKTMVENKAAQVDYSISIPNYGSGNISIYIS